MLAGGERREVTEGTLVPPQTAHAIRNPRLGMLVDVPATAPPFAARVFAGTWQPADTDPA
jgi:hypothetical protein